MIDAKTSRGRLRRALPFIILPALLAGCTYAVVRSKPGAAPLRTVSHVDLPRYMGDWRVISEIPYFAEKGCVDSIESYGLLPDGTIHNWFTYRKGSFSAPRRRIDAYAWVVNKQTNAEWHVRFFGLITADYVILDLDPNYQWTVVGHPSRNYGWIMAREKTMPASTYRSILQRLAAQGYDTSRFKMVPQSPSQPVADWKPSHKSWGCCLKEAFVKAGTVSGG